MATDGITPENTSVPSQGDKGAKNLKIAEIWRTVRAGNQPADEALHCFREDGGNYYAQTSGGNAEAEHHFKIGGYAFETLKGLLFGYGGEAQLALVTYEALKLGRKDETLEDLRQAVAKRGNIAFCRGEDLIRARLDYDDQPLMQSISVPVEDNPGQLKVFRLESYCNITSGKGRHELWILEGDGRPDRECAMEELFLVRILSQEEKQPEPAVIETNESGNQTENQDPAP